MVNMTLVQKYLSMFLQREALVEIADPSIEELRGEDFIDYVLILPPTKDKPEVEIKVRNSTIQNCATYDVAKYLEKVISNLDTLDYKITCYHETI